jgi:polysaccharide deacetylase 2 family uncharacterized protein YibQ
MRKRGLMFVEDGSMATSMVASAAKSATAEARKANLVIDANPDPKAILAALQMLEEQAQVSGTAIGTGTGLDVTIDTLAAWAKDAAERGVIIIPVTAAFKGRLG